MKLIYEPTVHLVARPRIDAAAMAALMIGLGVDWVSDADSHAEGLAEAAGRLCYLSFAKPRPGGNAAYLRHILESGHGSVLEHANWTFVVTGVSRSLSHELVRHRHLSFSQLSQRYVDDSQVAFVVPPDLRAEVDEAREVFRAGGRAGQTPTPSLRAGVVWVGSAQRSLEDYRQLADHLAAKAAARGLERTEARKFARQAARSVLPNCTETMMAVTGNARAWRGVIDQRATRHADPEIRTLAVKLWEALKADSPALFGDYAAGTLPDGTTELTTTYRKV